MKSHRVLAVARKTFLTIRHDPRSLGLMLLAPVMAMLVFGFAFGTEVEHVETIVVNEDEGGEAVALIVHLDPVALDVTLMDDADAARQRVLDGDAVALLRFPPNFTENSEPTPGTPPQTGPGGVVLQPGTPPQPPKGASIEVFVDGTNSQMAATVQRALADALRSYAEEKGGSAPVTFDTRSAYAADARFIDYFVPGIMAFAALMFTTILTLLAFVQERTLGTLDRLRVTPVTEGEIVAGYALAFGVIGAAQGVLLLSSALLLFDVILVGSVLLAGTIVVLLAVDAQAIGILISSAAQREGQAVQFIPFYVLPTFLLSGIFIPVESLPDWLVPLAWALPPTWAIDALRDVMLRGWGFERVWLNVLVLAAFGVFFLGLAVAGLKRARR